MPKPTIHHHLGDLPSDVIFPNGVAIDTEAMGLNPHRDRLCVVQLSGGDHTAHIIQLNLDTVFDCPNLKALLSNDTIQKIYHYGRFDIAVLYQYLGVMTKNVFCTKIASKLTRTYTSRHGLKSLCSDLLGIELCKQSQTSDWGATTLTKAQLAYAASDVLYLHKLKDIFEVRLARENRTDLAKECFDALPTVAKLDLLGYEDLSLFHHM